MGNLQRNGHTGKTIAWMRGRSVLGLMVVFGCIGATVASQAQPLTVTVQQALQEAVEKNLTLLAERYNLSIAETRILTAGLRPNPVLSIGSDHLDLLGTKYNEINAAGPPEYSIRTDFIWERGQKRRYRMEVAQQEKAIAQAQLLNATRALVLDVQNAFVEILLAKETLALAQRNQNSFRRIVQISTERVRAGDLAPVELVRTQLAELQFNNAVIQGQARLRIAKQRLQLLMGRLVPSESFDITGELRHDSLPVALADLQQQALIRRPDYQALVKSEARSQANIRLQLAQGKSDFTFGTEYRRQQGLAGTGNSLGFFMSIPLPIFNRNQGEIERARQEQRQVVARLHALETEIRNELSAAWQQYEASRVLLARIETDMLGQARRVLATMEYSYRTGAASLVELLDAQRAFNDTMQSYNDARAEYARSFYLLDAAVGNNVR